VHRLQTVDGRLVDVEPSADGRLDVLDRVDHQRAQPPDPVWRSSTRAFTSSIRAFTLSKRALTVVETGVDVVETGVDGRRNGRSRYRNGR
jgi:hypothetical protein